MRVFTFFYRFIAISLLLVSLIAGGLWMDFSAFVERPLALSKTTTLTIPKGMNVRRLADLLYKKAWIDNRNYFYVLALWKKKTALKAGEYTLRPPLKAEDLLDILITGKVTVYPLTLIEGWTFKQVLVAVNNSPYLQHTLTGFSAQKVMDKLGYSGIHPEGRFFPDTYHVARNTADVVFLQRAFRTMQKVLQDEWQQRQAGLPLNNADEALILASIVEKETGRAKERKTIAGVFIRRLQKKMRLQSDPTVIYGLGERYQGNIKRQHLREKNAYNTYVIQRLPKTPIAMPGKEAIHAVLHPEEGDSLYFVAKGNGQHYFSATLREHNNAVRRYQLKKR